MKILEIALEIIREWEWLLLILVASLEGIILINSSKERKERNKLIDEMQVTRVELGRENYLTMIKGGLKKSTSYVYFVSHSLTSIFNEKEKNEIYQLYKRDIDHRCITGKDPGKIKYMWEQRRNRVQVRVNELLLISTFRYQVVDDKSAVLGFAEEGDDESRKGILITNPYFCRMQKQYFLNIWEESETFESYIKSVVSNLLGPELNYSLEELTKDWCLNDHEKQELKNLLSDEN